MENKTYKYIILVCTVCLWINAISQGNPGFLGKKTAIGYNSQLAIIKPINLFKDYINHDFYLEKANSKYSSFSVHGTFAKSQISNRYLDLDNEFIEQIVKVDGSPYEMTFDVINRDITYFMYGLGAKYSYFQNNKTIASPVGLSYFVRADVLYTGIVKKNIEFEFLGGPFDEDFINEATNDLNNNYNPSPSVSFSLGFGVESKFMLSPKFYTNLKVEMNIPSRFLNFNNYYSNHVSYNEYLTSEILDFPKYRNLLLAGVGFGILL